jgi:hypothetical protein
MARDIYGRTTGPEPTPLEADAQGHVKVPVKTPVELVCRVELTQPIEHARLSISRPAGVEQIGSRALTSSIAGAEERDDAFHFFIGRWETGVHEIRFPIRAELVGTVMVPWPDLETMYTDSPATAYDAATVWKIEGK